LNNTIGVDEKKTFANIRKYLNGYVRDIYYSSHEESFDPKVSEKNRILYIYEGYYENGVLRKDPNESFGRYFLTNTVCYIGYFSYDTNERDFLLYGKGMIIEGSTDKVLQKGLFVYSRDMP
jgi:hypothetical protein